MNNNVELQLKQVEQKIQRLQAYKDYLQKIIRMDEKEGK